MNLLNLVISVSVACVGVSSALFAPAAMSQAKEQFFPGLPYRTGAYDGNHHACGNKYEE